MKVPIITMQSLWGWIRTGFRGMQRFEESEQISLERQVEVIRIIRFRLLQKRKVKRSICLNQRLIYCLTERFVNNTTWNDERIICCHLQVFINPQKR